MRIRHHSRGLNARASLFKEKGIELPSNFSSIGYIELEKDKLSEKGIELFRELVDMKILEHLGELSTVADLQVGDPAHSRRGCRV